MKLFGREPTLWLAVISQAIVLIGTFGFRLLNPDQAGLVVAAINGAAAAVNAYAVRPISPTTFTYLIGIIVALASTYGANITPDQLAILNTGVISVLSLLSRGQVSPADTVLSRRTTADEKAVAEEGTGKPPSATVEG